VKKHSGFTLIEALTAVVMLAILTAVALPNYRIFVQSQKVRQASYDLTSSLLFARSEAIKRNATVTMDQATGGWTNGWQIAAGGVSLRSQDAYPGGITITNSDSLTAISYSGDGRLSGGGSTFKIGSAEISSSVTARCVVIQLGGMPTSKVGGC